MGFSSSIVEISIHENNIAKGVDFLNKLAQNSVDYTLDKKNQIALNTIEFIEKQLIGVADSLGAAESILRISGQQYCNGRFFPGTDDYYSQGA